MVNHEHHGRGEHKVRCDDQGKCRVRLTINVLLACGFSVGACFVINPSYFQQFRVIFPHFSLSIFLFHKNLQPFDNLFLAVEPEKFAVERESKIDSVGIVGVRRSTGWRTAVQASDSMACGERCERANFDLLHMCERKFE